MLQCTSCKQRQARGKFCGSCGSPLEKLVENEELVTSPEPKNEASSELKGEEAGQNIEQSHSEEEQGSSQPLEETVEVEKDMAKNTEEQIIASQQEAAAVTTDRAVSQQQAGTDVQGSLQSYWEYSVKLLKNPSKAFAHGEDKFVYSLINLALYALMFSLVIASIVRNLEFPLEYVFESDGSLYFQLIIYLFFFIAIAFGIVLVSLLAMEKMFIKRMTFKEIMVQYSGILMPLIFVQAIVLLFTFIGTSFFVFIIIFAVLFYGLFFLTGIFIYEKVMYYQSTENKVYVAIGTTILVSVAFTIFSIIVGESLLNEIFDELFDYLMYMT